VFHATDRRLLLSRKQFWEAFTDHGVQSGREWLSLPLEHFYVFVDTPDAEHVDAVEVLMVLALFCESRPSEALAFCFDVFDADQSSTMDRVRHTLCFGV